MNCVKIVVFKYVEQQLKCELTASCVTVFFSCNEMNFMTLRITRMPEPQADRRCSIRNIK
jgi:hypothetical protein